MVKRQKKKTETRGRKPVDARKRMGRPLDVRFSEEQREEIKRRAEEDGKPVSQWVRERLGVV